MRWRVRGRDAPPDRWPARGVEPSRGCLSEHVLPPKRSGSEVNCDERIEISADDAAHEDPSTPLPLDVANEPADILPAPGLCAHDGALGPGRVERVLAPRGHHAAARLHHDLSASAH